MDERQIPAALIARAMCAVCAIPWEPNENFLLVVVIESGDNILWDGGSRRRAVMELAEAWLEWGEGSAYVAREGRVAESSMWWSPAV